MPTGLSLVLKTKFMEYRDYFLSLLQALDPKTASCVMRVGSVALKVVNSAVKKAVIVVETRRGAGAAVKPPVTYCLTGVDGSSLDLYPSTTLHCCRSGATYHLSVAFGKFAKAIGICIKSHSYIVGDELVVLTWGAMGGHPVITNLLTSGQEWKVVDLQAVDAACGGARVPRQPREANAELGVSIIPGDA